MNFISRKSDNVIAAVVLGSLAAFLIWNVPFVQRIATPERYWRKQVARLEQQVTTDSIYVRNLPQQIEEMQRVLTSKDEYIDSLVHTGWSPEGARELVSDLEKVLRGIQSGLEMYEKKLEEDSLALNRAKRRLIEK